ncbi:GntR family transcriptional regulator [Fundicoccus sp. Sow4_H7]|uniref:GntR family transcriptional regulator n=1 Tax=Fundicoccus sp. Sow4_H7 TaxID=3438784 RepID=UPI003F8F212B
MEFDKHIPIYEQLVVYFKQSIASGKYLKGAALPSRRSVAAQFKINPNTVQRAFKVLEEEGIIETKSNIQSTVTENQAILDDIRQDFIHTAIETMYETLKPLNLTKAQLLGQIKKVLDQYMKEDDHV